MISDHKPLGRQDYEQFAARYAQFAPTKPANALYERPATLSLLPDNLRGLKVLDAGCGPGIYSALLAKRGALVHALDVTPQMVDLARSRLSRLGVEVRQADLAQPLDWLDNELFDLVLCPLVLDHIEDWRPVFQEFHRVTRREGSLVFSAFHPIADWELSGAAGSYYDRALFGLDWKGFGEPRPHVRAYRRPFGAIINPLIEAGWSIDRVLEPRPSEELKAADPRFYEKLVRIPYFICVRATRR